MSLRPLAPSARARSISARNRTAVDFAEGRRRADDDRRAEDVRAEDVAQRRASWRAHGRLRLAARLRKYGRRSCPLDQRAHPPRRRFAGAGKGEERPAKPRRDIASLAGRAFRGQRVVAGEKHRERPVARRLEADVRVDVAERQAPLRVEDEAELRRQPPQALVLPEPRLQRRDARSEIKQSFRIEVVERTCDDVAQALDLGIGVDEPGFLEARMQVGQRSLAQAAQVKIGARRKADRAIAAAQSRRPPARRPDRATIALSAPARAQAVRRRSPSA